MHNKNIGSIAEDLAISYLISRNLRFWKRNYNTRFGEIDLIMLSGKEVVFVEVKSNRSSQLDPIENITERKLLRLGKAIDHFIYFHEITDYRLDIVGVTFFPDIQFEWLIDI